MLDVKNVDRFLVWRLYSAGCPQNTQQPRRNGERYRKILNAKSGLDRYSYLITVDWREKILNLWISNRGHGQMNNFNSNLHRPSSSSPPSPPQRQPPRPNHGTIFRPYRGRHEHILHHQLATTSNMNRLPSNERCVGGVCTDRRATRHLSPRGAMSS